AGSTGLTGAAMLASQAAQRSGAGLVRLALPASLNAICESALPEIMTLPLPDAGRGFLGPDALDALAESLEWAQAVVLGPGLGRDPGTQELVIRLIASCTKPLVLDADALVAAAGNIEVLAENDSPRVITPHPGELARLLGQEKPLAHHALVEAAADLAGELDLTVILKGGPTVILGADRSVRVNSTGNHGMATGGTGDVLAGLLGGLLAQGCDPDEAPALAVWLHGRAGDLAAKRQGARSMGAIDLLGKLSRAFRELEALS
ncbi:MAG: NAD(P)H-hydrate dehydratase, partial [Candidatus Cloacimonetes bacterium]|nr:NAD(P)H-hydrate dehydratase [Candidatus Cloacimonadota bacterium]